MSRGHNVGSALATVLGFARSRLAGDSVDQPKMQLQKFGAKSVFLSAGCLSQCQPLLTPRATGLGLARQTARQLSVLELDYESFLPCMYLTCFGRLIRLQSQTLSSSLGYAWFLTEVIERMS